MIKIRKIISFMLVAVLAMALALPAMAESIATVTYTNSKIDSPNLYITKTIQVTDGDASDYADTEFTFTLWLDGELARQVYYTVWDSNGNQVFQYSDGESTEQKSNAIDYKTTRQGVFTLKPGQTARFEELDSGTAYKVEEDTESGWVQILPSGGSAAEGTVATDGTSVTFTNLKEADTSGGGDGDSESYINVYKTASFPSGWTLAVDSDFTFRITISGDPYVLEDFLIYSQSDNSLIAEDDTDSDGQFTLKAGQYAHFTVPSDVDYTIEELTTEGWRVTTADEFEGSTGTGATTVLFNNASASFIVTNTLTGDDIDEEDADTDFTFVLSDEYGNIWGNDVNYWVYDIYGNPQYDDNGNVLSGTTDKNGEFTLKAGQAAVFYGISAGRSYTVTEKATSGWQQVLPNTSAGYTRSVTDAVEILPFQNEKVDLTGSLAVTKNVTSTGDAAAPSDDEFTFTLYDENKNAKADTVYTVQMGQSTYSYATDGDGRFTLMAGQTAVFDSLTYGTYGVAEVAPESDEYYTLEAVSVNGEEENGAEYGEIYYADLSDDGARFVFSNEYERYIGSITIVKKDRNRALEGVEFTLKDANGETLDKKMTDKDGKAVFSDLASGEYVVTETATLPGYSLLKDPLEIEIPLVLTPEEVEEGNVDTTDAIYDYDSDQWKFYNLTYEVTDDYNLSMPTSGGTSVVLYIVIIGIALVAVAVIYEAYRHRRFKVSH